MGLFSNENKEMAEDVAKLKREIILMNEKISILNDRYMKLKGYTYKKAGDFNKDDTESENLNTPFAKTFL